MTGGHEEEFQQHVAAVNRWEPTAHALISWDEASARQRAEAALDGPIAGWAVGIKDIIDVEGYPTRCGVDFLPATPVPRDAQVVERLRSLGAYVFSKVVTTAFAYLDPGPTTNPWNVGHTPGGSSQGSAVTVATGMVRLALGSQTGASVARPAAFCGVVGFKPTFERMSHDGLMPFAPSFDTVGFFTKNLADMQTASRAFFDEPDDTASSSPRIGVVEDMYCEPADDDMLAAVRAVADKLKASGFDVRPAHLPEALRDAHENHVAMMAGESAEVYREIFKEHGEKFSPKLREIVVRGQAMSPGELEERRSRREEFEASMDGIFDEFDVLLTPSAPGAAPKGLDTTGDFRMSVPITHTRTPSVTLPARLNESGLPLGLQFVARKMEDATLLAACRSIESVIDFDEKLPEGR